MDQYPGQTPPPNSPPPGYPQQPGYPPQGAPSQPGVYPPGVPYQGQEGYPQPGYPTQPGYLQPGYAPQSGYPQQPGYPPQPGAYLPTAPYPGQPGYMQPQPPRKGKAGLWITLLVIVVILGAVGGVGYFLVLPKLQQTSPNGTLQTFCDGYKTLNAHEIYGTFSSSFQTKSGNSESEIESGFALIKGMGATVDGCTVSNVQVNGSTATATVTLAITALGKSDTSSEHVSLVLENGVWKINDVQDSGSTL